jgi:hypothetical protein
MMATTCEDCIGNEEKVILREHLNHEWTSIGILFNNSRVYTNNTNNTYWLSNNYMPISLTTDRYSAYSTPLICQNSSYLCAVFPNIRVIKGNFSSILNQVITVDNKNYFCLGSNMFFEVK